MANIVSYNDLIELFEDISRRHYQINTFFLGRDWELENNNDLQYPVLQVYPEVAKMPINNWKEYKTLDLTFNVKVIDLTVPGEENERDVHSDTLRIAQDIVNELNQHPYYIRSNVSLMEDIDFTAIEEFEDDVTAGWQFNLKLRIINANTFCGMPMAELNGVSAAGPTSQGTIVNVQYLTCETLPDCPSIETIEETLVDLQEQIDNLPPSNNTLAQTLLYGNTTGNTTITAGTNLNNILQVSDTVMGLSWNGVVGGNLTLDDTGTYLYSDSDVIIESQNTVDITGPLIRLKLDDGFNITRLVLEKNQTVSDTSINNNMVIIDNISNKGIVYFDDYSANFTDNSLVTKAWVLSNTSSYVPYTGANANVDLGAYKITSSTFQVTPAANATASASQTVDLTISDHWTYTLSTNTTFTFSNATNGKTWTMAITQASSVGAYTVTFAGGTIKWQNAVTPVMTPTINKTDIYSFVQMNGIIYGSYIQNF